MTRSKRKTQRRTPQAPHGKRIRAWRMLRGLSLQDVSDMTGIRKPGLSMMERGQQQITLAHLDKILSALRVSWDEFGVEPPPPPADTPDDADDGDNDKNAAAG